VSSKQEIVFEDHIEVKRYEARMSHRDGFMLSLQYGGVKQKIVLKDNKRGEAVECNLKSEMMNAMGKERGLKQNRIVGIENAVEMKTKNKIYEGYQWKRSVNLRREAPYRVPSISNEGVKPKMKNKVV